MLRFYTALLIALLALSIAAGFARFWILTEMAIAVNRAKSAGEELDPFALSWRRASWYRVAREYKSVYPGGSLSRYMRLAIAVTISCFLAMATVLFGVLPKRALPAR